MEKNFVRKGIVDGLPSSFDFNFILKSHKFCHFCKIKFTEQDIEENKILYTDELEYIHKQCLFDNKMKYKHLKQGDFSSPVTLYNLD